MEFKKIKIEQLIHADYNPRKDLKAGDREYEKIKRSIQEFGYVEPVIVNRHGCDEGKYLIVGGHQRTKVLKDLGYDEIDCVVVDMDKQKEKALNIALNKITGEWDFNQLAVLMEELKLEDYDLELTGFDFSEAEQLLDSLKDENEEQEEEEIEVPENPISQKGDVWLLGKHRLMCGDSTDKETVETLMNGEKASMVFTDPPWNVSLGSTDHPSWKKREILNDSMSTEDFKEFMNKTFQIMNQFSKEGCMTYVVMSAQEWGNLMLSLADNSYHWSSTIIWNKDSIVLSRKDYHTRFEPIWYGWKEGQARLHPLKDRKQCDVWDISRPKVSKLHPTTKPVQLVTKAIKNSSNMYDIVLDQFGGSGSTLIACQETDRVCYTMELDEKYADVIVNRYIAHSGADDSVYLLRNGEEIAYSELLAELEM